jgi:hypothetical protein
MCSAMSTVDMTIRLNVKAPLLINYYSPILTISMNPALIWEIRLNITRST